MPGWLADRPLRAKGVLVIAIPSLLLLVVGAGFYGVQARDVAAQEWVIHTRTVEAQLNLVESLVFDAEFGKRGYMATGDPVFMITPQMAEDRIPAAVETLASLVADNAAQEQRVAKLRTLLAARVSTASAPARSMAELRAWMLEQKAANDQIRAQVDRMGEAEGTLLVVRERTAHAWTVAGDALVGVSVGLGLLSALLGMLLFTTAVLRRVRRIEGLAGQLQGTDDLQPPDTARDELGQLSRVLFDVGQVLRRRDQELRDAEGFLAAVIDSSPALITRWTPESGPVFVSANCEQVLGIPAEQLRAAGGLLPFVAEADRPKVAEMTSRVLRGELAETDLEVTVQTDRKRVMELHATRLEVDGRVMIQGHYLDVTDRRAAERELVEREAQLQAIMAASPDGIYVVGGDLAVTWMSEGMRHITGVEPTDRLGHRTGEAVHPEDRQEFEMLLESVRGGRTEVGVSRHRRPHAAGGEVVVEARMRRMDPTSTSDGVLIMVRDVTEQARLVEQLEAAREDAVRANGAKSEFLSRMSHELRTPLNAILGFAQLLDMDELGTEQQEAVRQIARGGRHLLDLINEVLDISRIESGQIGLSPERVLVSDVLAEVLDLVGPLAKGRGVSILAPPDGVCDAHVVADRQRLKQVLLNLVSNAIKYNRDNGQVRLSCGIQPDGMFGITVTDTGIGVPAGDMDRLFTPFDRLGAEVTGVEGTGVGLALSMGLARAMGGWIEVESTPGVGSSFTAVLPLSEDEEPPASQSDPVSPETEGVSDALGAPAARGAAGGDVGELTVVYVEDNLANLRLVEQIAARRPGVRLVHAMQGRLGLELVTSTRPGLVLLDLHLPDISGEEVLRRLRAEPATAHTPIVIISADATPGQVRRLRDMGATGYLTKPFDVAELLTWLDDPRHGREREQGEPS